MHHQPLTMRERNSESYLKSELRTSNFEGLDSCAPAHFDPPQAGLPIYVARVPRLRSRAGDFASEDLLPTTPSAARPLGDRV